MFVEEISSYCVEQKSDKLNGLATKAEGKHLFPSRTQKLSPPAIWVVLWYSHGKPRTLPVHSHHEMVVIY